MTIAGRKSEILGEARELAATLARDLHGHLGDGAAVNGLFRSAHSLKGLAGLLGANAAQSVAHAIEDVLDEVRHGRARLEPALREGILDAVERCGVLLERGDDEAAGRVAQRLHALMRAAAVQGGVDPLAELELPAIVAEALTGYELARLGENLRIRRQIHRVTVGFALEDFDRGLDLCAREIHEHGELIATLPADTGAEISFELLAASNLSADALLARLAGLDARVDPVARTPRHAGEDAAAETKDEAPQRVRVPLAAVRALQAAIAENPDVRLQAALRALTRVAGSEIAARVEGAVLSVAAAWGRQVRLVSSGANVELDVAAAEALAEPLVHLVRNALDHGIEPPGERLRLGKDPRGTLHLDFVERLDTIEVRFTDDGAGIDADRVAAVALALGVADARAIAAMSPEQRMQLVFAPGVSTAAPGGRSGRGVGLDVVRDVVMRLGGSVRVASTPGIGTTFVLEVPLA